LIYVHNHVIPPFYLTENRDRIDVSLSRVLLDWTPQQSIDAMDQHGVETAVLSLSTPGVWFGNAETARSTARRVNEYCFLYFSECSLLVRLGYRESCSFGVRGRYGRPFSHDALFRGRLSGRPYGLWDGLMRVFCLDV